MQHKKTQDKENAGQKRRDKNAGHAMQRKNAGHAKTQDTQCSGQIVGHAIGKARSADRNRVLAAPR